MLKTWFKSFLSFYTSILANSIKVSCKPCFISFLYPFKPCWVLKLITFYPNDMHEFYITNEFCLSNTKGRIILTCISANDYPCRITFVRGKEINQLDRTKLNFDDFQIEGRNWYFRRCIIDPRRRDVFVSFHSRDKVRRLATKEYYDTAGNVK